MPLRRGACALLLVLPTALLGQLTTGVLEGIVRDANGHPVAGAPVVITGAPHFRTQLRTDTGGKYSAVLPYGEYEITSENKTVPVVVHALEAGSAIDLHDDWPEANTLPSIVADRDAEAVSAPPNIGALGDYRLATLSLRGTSWTETRFKLMGMDATDSYQPGMPVILPDVQALDEIVDRDSFAPAEVTAFLHQPGNSWHVRTSSANVPEGQYSKWLTRDAIEGAGPLAKWADIFARGTAQWSDQSVPSQAPGTDQRGRLLFGDVRGRFRLGARDQLDALFSGSRINLNDWGAPEGLEILTGLPIWPAYTLPVSYPGGRVTDHLDFLQTGWTHQMPAGSRLGAFQLRYGYSATHLSTYPPPNDVFGAHESRIELSNGAVSEIAPMANLAIRTRQEIQAAWLPGTMGRHHLAAGGGWKSSRPVNRVTVPSDVILFAVNGAPADALELNAPLFAEAIVRATSGWVTDRVVLGGGFSADLGVLVDLSRGSLPRQGSGVGQFAPVRTFPAQSDLIVWNSVSPRAGLAWQRDRLELRAGWARLYDPLAGRYLDYQNPNSLSGTEYQWIDRNGDGRFQLGEEGAALARFGGLYSSISPSLKRPYGGEYHGAAEFELRKGSVLRATVFRRDDRQRVAGIDVGVPESAFIPVQAGGLTVYNQDPSTLGQDQYLLTNPAGLTARNYGWTAEFGTAWHAAIFHASFMAVKSEGLTNLGDSFFQNDPGLLGTLLLNPNSSINAEGRTGTDYEHVAKLRAMYQLPKRWGGVDLSTIAWYTGGIPVANQVLVTGLDQGPIVVPAMPRGAGGGSRTDAITSWNLRALRAFPLPFGTLTALGDVLNAANSGHGAGLWYPDARTVRLQLRYEF